MSQAIRIALFGAANFFKLLGRYPELGDRKRFAVSAIFDNNPAFAGHTADGVAVSPPSDHAARAFDHVLIDSAHYGSIAGQLVSLGIAREKILPDPRAEGHGSRSLAELIAAAAHKNPQADISLEGAYRWAHIPYDPDRVPDTVYHAAYPPEALLQRSFYNIGAGSFRHKYWTNVDYSFSWYAPQQGEDIHINHDLLSLKPLPIDTATAEAVYSSNTVEHVTDEAVLKMFQEAYRILKPGGVFRVTTPDTDLFHRAWRSNDTGFYYWLDFYSHPDICAKTNRKPFNTAPLGQAFLFNFASHVSELQINKLPKVSTRELTEVFDSLPYEQALDHFTALCPLSEQYKRPGLHINWFNEAKLRRLMTEAGFPLVYRSGFGQSLCPAMRDVTLFDLQDPKASIYMEARK